jgi:hypothetical protein
MPSTFSKSAGEKNFSSIIGQGSISFFRALGFELCFTGNGNKATTSFTQMQHLQGFRCKKKTLRILLCKVFFLLWFKNWGCPKSNSDYLFFSAIAA